MINIHPLFSAVLLSALALSACDSAGTSPESGLPLADDADGQARVYLPTGSDESDVQNTWFCTYTSNGEYLDRKEMRLFESGLATVDGVAGSWSLDEASFTVNYGISSDQFDGLVFATRYSNADVFNASTAEGIDMTCDWSGPPRDGGILDDGNNTLGIEEITGDTIDDLLSTGRSDQAHDTHWLCQSDAPAGELFELFLFDDGTMISTSEGRWSRVSATAIELRINGATELLGNVDIDATTGSARFSAFTADSSVRGPIACQWNGKPRASAWTGSE